MNTMCHEIQPRVRHCFFCQPFIEAQIKETSKLRFTGLSAGNSPVTGEFPALRASNAEFASDKAFIHKVVNVWL